MLRIVVDARRISAITATNAITIKDTPERITAAGKIITAIDKARPEVIIDVELLEVNRTHLHEYGLQIATVRPARHQRRRRRQQAGALAPQPVEPDERRRPADEPAVAVLPPAEERFGDAHSRQSAAAHLRRALRRRRASASVCRCRSRRSAPIAAGGVQTQPITSFNYEPIGVNIDITPRMHHDDAVTLSLKVELSSISGKGFGDLPTFGSRQINTVIRLKDGETNMLAGSDSRRRAHVAGRHSRSRRHPGHRPAVRLQPQGDAGNRHHPDADAAHCSRAESDRRGSQPFKVGRDGGAPLTDIVPPCPAAADSAAGAAQAARRRRAAPSLAPQFPTTPARPCRSGRRRSSRRVKPPPRRAD